MAKTLSDVVRDERGDQTRAEAKQAFFDVGWPPAVADKKIESTRIANYHSELAQLRRKLSLMAKAKETGKEAATGAMDLLSIDPVESLLTNYVGVPQIIDLGGRLTSVLNATGLGSVGSALQAAAPVLGPVGLAAWLGTMVLAGVSAYKTHKHVKKLNSFYTRREEYSPAASCIDLHGTVQRARILAQEGWSDQQKEARLRSMSPALGQTRQNESRNAHLFILDNVLPYVIAKKEAKRTRKGASAIGLGLLEGIRAKGKALYKIARGTRGDHRQGAAAWIAYHWSQHHCLLCYDVVLELCGDKAEQMRFWAFKDVVPALAEKMKSV
jgi:hypothetical protein